MTELDPNIILQAKQPQIASPFELASGAMHLRNLGLQGQNQQITLEQNQRALTDQKTIADLYRANTQPDGSVNHAGVVQGLAQAGLGDKIPAYQQQVATASKDTTAASMADLELHQKKLGIVNNALASLVSKPDLNQNDVIGAINGLVNNGVVDPQTGAQMARQIPGRPEQLRPFLMQKGLETMDVQKQIEARLATAPKYNAQDQGGAINQGTVDPLTGQRTAGANVRKTVSADTQANITKDYAVAGLNPDGTPGQANQALIKMIGEGRMIPSDRLESTPRGQAVLAGVEAQYPGYDVTTARAKQKAANDFGAGGKDGAALRSIGTATKHLDMLSGLVDNLDNTNSPAFNAVANFWKTQTGGTAPKTFDAAKQIVGQEVIKAIVAGGGGVGERQEAADALSKASSTAQLKSVIDTYKTIMGAQHESLLQQRDAAGLPRSTLPDYTEGASNAPGAAPSNQLSTAAYALPSNDPAANTKNWDKRADGSDKGQGFLGLLKRPDGRVSSEISVGVNIGGKEVEVPTMVPTLSQSQLDYLMNNPIDSGHPIPRDIVQKATDYARQRIAAGKSPFAGPGEQTTLGGSKGPPVPVKSDADYKALKSGTRFTAPDGSVRVKP